MAAVVIVFAMVAIVIVFTPVETVSKVRIAIIDGGIDPTYPALNKAKIEVRSVPGAPSRVSEHGSAMAAIMVESASAKPSTRSPTIEIVDVPALDISGVGEVEDLATGITTATQQDVDMIVAALGTEMDAPELKEAVRHAQNDGVTIFSAAGNGIGD
ncbi:S8 family serine peptidase, partial [Brevibacterium aurantiacum]|uniref:S8 family serine peptidase n=2 Tax=Brevibacteriaceae TaxID=85019 RepID=UPI001866E2BE